MLSLRITGLILVALAVRTHANSEDTWEEASVGSAPTVTTTSHTLKAKAAMAHAWTLRVSGQVNHRLP